MRISVVIPCYNSGAFLRDAIQSVLNQTRPAHQIIVVDDGSTDDSSAIANSFGGAVTLLRQDNKGVSDARNAGIAVAEGEYLHFLDADDLLDPRAFEVLSDAVGGTNDGVGLMGITTFVKAPDQPSSSTMPQSRTFFPAIIKGNIGTPHAWLFPTRIIREVGAFRPGLSIYEDWECWCRVALAGAPLITVNFLGSFYRRHETSTFATASPLAIRLGHIRVMLTLCEGLLSRPRLFDEHADTLFWSTWTAFHRGLNEGLPLKDLEPVARHLETISRRHPGRNRFATAVRWLGARRAESLRALLVRDHDVDGP